MGDWQLWAFAGYLVVIVALVVLVTTARVRRQRPTLTRRRAFVRSVLAVVCGLLFGAAFLAVFG